MFSKTAAGLLLLGQFASIALTATIPSALSIPHSSNATLQQIPPFHIPNTDLSVEFYHIGGVISTEAALSTVEAAYNEATYKSPSGSMGKGQHRWTEHNPQHRVNLKATARGMLWGEWYSATTALKEFVTAYGGRENNFNVFKGAAVIGWGYFEDNTRDSDDDFALVSVD